VRALTRDQAASLRDWFLPDRPGPLVGLHVLQTGNGTLFADRWPDPRAIVAEVAGNYSLVGDPDALQPGEVQAQVVGFVDAPERFNALLHSSAFPTVIEWERIILDWDLSAMREDVRTASSGVRRLRSADAAALVKISPEVSWLAKTWGGLAGLATSGCAWGAFVDDRIVSIACTFFVGERYEDIGVATEPAHRGRGLSTACAAGLCADIRNRGRLPTWTTSPDNEPSLRVADKLGFVLRRHDRLLVVGRGVPETPRRW
jgi:RimJ/RimL family protein N-acetyltransferase